MSNANVFYLSLATLGCGGLGLILKFLYRVKCSEISICGMCLIKRDVEREIEIDLENNRAQTTTKRTSFSFGSMKPLINPAINSTTKTNETSTAMIV